MFYHSESSRRNKKAGFTLIEMLVVILILGILIAVAIPLYLNAVRNAGTRTVQTNIKTIAQAAQSYRVKHGAYPVSDAALQSEGNLEQPLANIGPGGVAYTIGPNASSEFEITATETTDVFGDSDVDNTLIYNLTTGSWTAGGFAL